MASEPTTGPATLPDDEEPVSRTGSLPALFRGKRRWWLCLLILLGLGQAAVAGLSAWALVRMNAAPGVSPEFAVSLVGLVTAALLLGALKVRERTVAERLGQDYVHTIRLELLESALTPGERTPLGITVARTTNDLSSVRNWVSQGLAPGLVGVPLILGSAGILTVLEPLFAVALLVPVAILCAALVLWARVVLIRTRELRRRRGRLASRIAETVTAAESIISAGGAERELKRIHKQSEALVDQAVHRARTVGSLRAAGMVASLLATMFVAAVGIAVTVPPVLIVAAMAIVGIAATPILDLGRIVEYRQTYTAARDILGPTLAAARSRRDATLAQRRAAAAVTAPDDADSPDAVHVRLPGLTDVHGPLRATAGDTVRLVAHRPGDLAAFAHRLLRIDAEGNRGPSLPTDADQVWIGGRNAVAMAPRQLRVLIGWARSGTVFERGRVDRALRYRRPDLRGSDDERALRAVGLDLCGVDLDERTTLRQGGAPLGTVDRHKLALARAIYGSPALLLIQDLDGQLDAAGLDHLVKIIENYPGVVLFSSSDWFAQRVTAREYRVGTA